MYRLAVLTVSDKGFKGEREDLSGTLITEMLSQPEYNLVFYEIVPDDEKMISDKLSIWADQFELNLIITTGGTGLAPRDVTPEATSRIIEREVPGLVEAIRMESLKMSPTAMLSRSIAGIRKGSLIINLPGSPKAVRECISVIQDVLPHALKMLSGTSGDHSNG
jgi:molybdenum cofactor synthesis domain-containing protein